MSFREKAAESSKNSGGQQSDYEGIDVDMDNVAWVKMQPTTFFTGVFPENEALFTAPENLIWGLHRDVELDVLDESDEVFEQDLFAKYAIRARHDYQVEDENAVVRIEGIEAPSA